MVILYRYLSEPRIDEFMRFGKVRFSSLSYYQDFEDAQIRGDEFEGTLRFRPSSGLPITLSESGKDLVLPHAFESSANKNDIFVHCLSTELDPKIASRFGANACVEIFDSEVYIAKIYYAIHYHYHVRREHLIHGPVRYYEEIEPPIGDWALPEKIAMAKLDYFNWQEEYRITFPIRNAFRVENVKVSLVPPGMRHYANSTNHPSRCIKLGSISNLCKVHRFT